MRRLGITVLFLLAFIFLPIIFPNAFVLFSLNFEPEVFTIDSLKSKSSDFVVSFNPVSSLNGEESQPYAIRRFKICDEYDDYGNCSKSVPDLCPYISLSPKNEESTEIGFPLRAYIPSYATGELNAPGDLTDDWTLILTSPCFEGECPVGYNRNINGDPLPQNLKGQNFKCALNVEWNGPIFPVYKLTNTVYADSGSNVIVEAVFTGAVENKINPVIIVPGIMGSAKKNGEWVIDPILHTYDNLIETLTANGYEKEKTLFTFPYEWRDSNVTTAGLLKDKISQVEQICKVANLQNADCNKVDVVAHSMGGLVVRQYIQSLDYLFNIDQLIFLGTPHKGSPKAYLQWEAGENDADLRSKVINLYFLAEAARNGYQSLFDYIQNRPIASVEQLLPIFNYLKDDDSGNVRNYPDNYPENDFLVSINNSLSLLLNRNINITNIIGDSEENKTIEYIRVKPTKEEKHWIHGEPDGFYAIFGDNGLERGVGDNTVTKSSAILNGAVNEEIISSHDRIPTVAENKIVKILTGKDSVTNIDNGQNLSVNVLFLQLLSPIDVVVTDPNSKKMGKNFETGEEYNEISGAFYSGYQTDEEYITILNPLNGEYKIELQGTDDGGKYKVMMSYLSENFATTTEVFGITKPDQITELETNIQNENLEDLKIERKITPDILIDDINGAYDLEWIKDKKTRDALIKQINTVVKFNKKIDIIKEKQRDGSIKQKKIEKFEFKINKILAQLFIKELEILLKKDKINQEAFGLIKSDIEYLINN